MPPPRRQSFTREVAASHLVSPSRLQVARQSYILEVSHIHLCDWRRSLSRALATTTASSLCMNLYYQELQHMKRKRTTCMSYLFLFFFINFNYSVASLN